MQQIGVALSKRLADHTHYSSGLGGDALAPLTEERWKYGEWIGDEFIDYSIFGEILYQFNPTGGPDETMDHRYEGCKVTLTDDDAIFAIICRLGMSAAITNNPLMTCSIWSDVAGSPGAVLQTFNAIPVYPACPKYQGPPWEAGMWASFVSDSGGPGWLPPADGDYWIIFDRSATAPVGGNILIEIEAVGTNAWVWSDNAIAWTTENNKGARLTLYGYTQSVAFMMSQFNAALNIVQQFGGYGVNALCYGGGDAIVGTSYEGRGGVFTSASNYCIYADGYKGAYINIWNEALGNSILELRHNNSQRFNFLNMAPLGHSRLYIYDGTGSSRILFASSESSWMRYALCIGATSAANNCSLLEIQSTSQGFLPPRMSTVQRDLIAAPIAGLIIWNTTTTQLEDYNGAAWAAV